MGVLRRNVRRVTHPDEQTDTQARRAPRIALIALGALVLIAVVAFLVRLLFGHEDNGTVAPAAPVASARSSAEIQPQSPASSATAASGSCQLDNTPKDVSSKPPHAESWVFAGDGLVPQVSGAGPCKQLSGFRAGYAHTMTGALVAAQTYVETFDVDAPKSSTSSALEYAVVDGPLKDSLRSKVKAIANGTRSRQDTSVQASLRLSGYRVSSYSPSDAVIELMFESTAPDLAGQAADAIVHLQWGNGDWRIVPVSSEDWFPASKLSSTAGFTSWGPNENGGSQ